MEFAAVFMWLCLALFGATGVIWLLDMVGVLTIRTPTQRKILNAALGTTLIGGMASFAVSTFFTPPAADKDEPVTPPTAVPSAPPSGAIAASPVAADSSPVAAPSSAPDPGPPVPQPSSCKPAAHPAEFAEWATPILGTPPTFRCAIGAPYPTCLAELREKPREGITQEDARACGDALLAFRRVHITPAYAAKNNYQDNLDAAEASLRAPRNEEDIKRRAYVIREIGRMNGTLWTDFTALDQRSKVDMLACQSGVQRCIVEP
jgi:hypothetical protein